jgi:hypothetical protein
MITVRVLVAVLPQVSVATWSMVSVATCVVPMTKISGRRFRLRENPQPGKFNNMRRQQSRAN